MRFINGLLAVLALIAIAWSVWVPGQEGMLQNLIAEVFGVWLAVVLIGEVMRRHQEGRELPARCVAFKEALHIHGEIAGIWAKAAEHVVAKNPSAFRVGKDTSLFSRDLANILAQLNLDEEAPVVPSQPWRVYLVNKAAEIKARIDRTLSRHSATLKPEIAASLHAVETSDFLLILEFQSQLPLIDQQMNVNRPPFLAWGHTHTGDKFIETMNSFGEQLADALTEFKGMPNLPDSFDPKLSSILPEIFKDTGVRHTPASDEATDD